MDLLRRKHLVPALALLAAGLACGTPGGSESETETETGGDSDHPAEGQPSQGPCAEGVGEWSPVIDWSSVTPEVPFTEQNEGSSRPGMLAIHAVHLPNRKILMWSGRYDQQLYDIDSGTFEWVPLTEDIGTDCGGVDFPIDKALDLFCSGHALDENGVMLTSGGNLDGSGTPAPTCSQWLDWETASPIEPVPASYDPIDDGILETSWTRAPNTKIARWYPTVTHLPDGRWVNFGGEDFISHPDAVETPDGPLLTATADTPLLEILREDGEWELVSGWPPAMANLFGPGMGFVSPSNYPSMFLLPDGNLVYTGGENATGGFPVVRNAIVFDTVTEEGVDKDLPPPSAVELGATGGYAVMYEPGKIMRAGGGESVSEASGLMDICESEGFPNADTEIIDLSESDSAYLNDPDRGWKRVGLMSSPRHFHNLVTLPTGSVVAVGGNSCGNGENHHTTQDFIEEYAVLGAEKWDPDTGLWCDLAAQVVPRMYHSTAVLLPDARVMSMGGGRRQRTSSKLNAEILTPPYLLNGTPRPVLGQVVNDGPLLYGSAIGVVMAEGSAVGWEDVSELTLVKLASTTHGFDAGQRFYSLGAPTLTASERIATFGMPINANELPPGWYMMFAISDAGTPSEALYVKIASPGAGVQQ